jgi:hypothetical protein
LIPAVSSPEDHHEGPGNRGIGLSASSHGNFTKDNNVFCFDTT